MRSQIVPFPLDAFPGWLRAMVEATARQAQASTDIAAVAGLGVLSAAVGRKGSVVLGRTRPFPLHLWLMVVGEPGDGKSEVFRNLGAPLRTVHRLPDDAEDEPTQETVRGRSVYERLRDRSLYTDADDRGERVLPAARLADAVVVLRRALTATGARASTLLLPDDITPTALIEALGANATGSALISAEGGFESWLMQGGGVASQSAASLNKAWDGESFTRVRRERHAGRNTQVETQVDQPALTMLVGVQPNVFDGFSRNSALRGRGFTLRFLFARSTLLRRVAPSDPTEIEIPEPVRAAFEAEVYRLICLPGWPPDHRARIPVSPAAARVNANFYNDIEGRTHGGDLAHAGPFARRLRSSLPRIAGLLHLARNVPVHGNDAMERAIDEQSMASALQVASYFLGEGLAALFGGTSMHTGTSLIEGVARLPASWIGSPDELAASLERVVPASERADWPRGTNNVMRFLRAHLRDLADRGIQLTEDRTNAARMVMIARRGDPKEG